MTTQLKDEAPLRWLVTDHICRICFSRVLTRTTFDHRKIFRCANCDTEVPGDNVTALCCCGMKLKGSKDAGVRCVANPDRSPLNPAVIVAQQVDAQISTRK